MGHVYLPPSRGQAVFARFCESYPHEAKQVYAEKHEELWKDFVEEAVERAGKPELMDSPGLSKGEFAEDVRGLE